MLIKLTVVIISQVSHVPMIRKKKMELCEVTDVNQTYCSNHFTGITCTHDKKKKKWNYVK